MMLPRDLYCQHNIRYPFNILLSSSSLIDIFTWLQQQDDFIFGQVEPILLATMAVCVCAILFIKRHSWSTQGRGETGGRRRERKRRKITVATFNALFMTLYDGRGEMFYMTCAT